MPKPRKLVYCRFLPYLEVRTKQPPLGVLWIDVSSSGDSPFDQFSPFFPHGGIPIPGSENQKSDSVEGIWQGLKVIRGRTAPRYFRGTGQKRGGKPRGHQFGNNDRLLGLVEARRKIYIPAYEWMLDHCIDHAIYQEILNNCFRGVEQCFYDREDNGSIGKDAPLAHAKVLVDYLNRMIDKKIDSASKSTNN